MAKNDETVTMTKADLEDAIARAAAQARQLSMDDQIALAKIQAQATAEANQAMINANKPAHERDNPNPPHISAFNPDGELANPRPRFHRQPWTNGSKEDRESLTHAEIEAFNDLSKKLERPGDRLTARGGKYVCRVSENGDNLMISFPCKSMEDKQAAPASIRLLCLEFMGQVVETDPEKMHDVIAQLQARIAALEGEKVSA